MILRKGVNMSLIKNASPQSIFLGTDDKSTRTVTPGRDPIPTHLPLFYVYAEKGPVTRELVKTTKFVSMYGTRTIDQNDKYYTHQTRFLMDIMGEGNTCMVQRLVPADAGVRANAVIYLDVLKTKLPNYIRDSFGGYIEDPETGGYKVYEDKPWIDGHKIKYIREVQDKEQTAGALRPKTGTMKISHTFEEIIPDALQVGVVNFKDKYKVGDVININFTPNYTGTDHTISSSEPTIVDFNDQGELVALSSGKATITVNVKHGEEAYVIKLVANVVTTDVNPIPELKVTNLRQVLDKDHVTYDISLEGENSENAIVTSANPNFVEVVGRTITGKNNGVSLVYITVPATGTHEGVTNVYTIQSKVPGLPPRTEVQTSTMYPLFEIKAKYQGEYYNNLGFALTSLFSADQNQTINNATKSLLYKLSLYVKPNDKTTPDVFRTLYGDPDMTFSFKEKAVNPDTEGRVDFEYMYENSYFNETNELLPLKLWDYENFHFYRENFEKLTKDFLELEKQYIKRRDEEWGDGEWSRTIEWFDFTTDDQDEIMSENLLLNPFICVSTKNVPYFTLVKETDTSVATATQAEVMLNGDTPIFLGGGSDGTFSPEDYEAMVCSKMRDYADPDTEVHDLAINVESIFYDTGFTLATKKELCNFITVRKDTALILTTYDWKNRDKQYSLADIRNIGEALKARLKLCPESEFYGTKVARGMVTMGGGKLKGDKDTSYKSPNYEIAIKASRMMGRGSGIWDTNKIFDNYPGNVVEFLTDVYPEFLPSSIKPTLWDYGLVWMQPYDRNSFHFPAFQTVYDNDTSVLNNFFVMMALCEVVKIGDRVWRKYTGTSSMGEEQFTQAVNAYCNELVSNKFGSVVTVIPEVFLTEADKQRGYSWNIVFKIYGDNMKTVCTITTQTYRSSDLQ